MPELPEVEVVKIFLEEKLIGQKISRLEVLNQKSFIGNPKLVEGQTITKFSRLGKQLSIHLSNHLILLVHLKMTGQLLYLPPCLPAYGGSRGGPELVEGEGFRVFGHPTKTINSKSTRIIFNFADSTRLIFNDQRKFGWIKVINNHTELAQVQKNLGLDIFDPRFTPKYLHSQLQRTSRPIKLALLDQKLFAGIGNIYANDSLFLARIHPLTPAKNISLSQSKILHRALQTIMQKSIKAGGSTAKDKKYLRPDGTYGQNQFNFLVYQQSGQPCPKCGNLINQIKISNRGTFFCPSCQPLTK